MTDYCFPCTLYYISKQQFHIEPWTKSLKVNTKLESIFCTICPKTAIPKMPEQEEEAVQTLATWQSSHFTTSVTEFFRNLRISTKKGPRCPCQYGWSYTSLSVQYAWDLFFNEKNPKTKSRSLLISFSLISYSCNMRNIFCGAHIQHHNTLPFAFIILGHNHTKEKKLAL